MPASRERSVSPARGKGDEDAGVKASSASVEFIGDFKGKGVELLGIYIGGLIINAMTASIASPWTFCWQLSFWVNGLRFKAAKGARATLEFHGTGLALVVLFLFNILLTVMTLGLYLPVAILKTFAFCLENTTFSTPSGKFGLTYSVKGMGAISLIAPLIALAVWVLTRSPDLSVLVLSTTLLGVAVSAMVLFSAILQAAFSGVSITQSGSDKIGPVQFKGRFSGLLWNAFVYVVLVVCTFGLGTPWGVVRFVSFFVDNLSAEANGHSLRFSFQGTGGRLFCKSIVGAVLIVFSLGLYTPWFMIDQARFFLNGTRVQVTKSKPKQS